MRNVFKALFGAPEKPYTGEVNRLDLPLFSRPRRPQPVAAGKPLERVVMVTTILASAEVICRWLWANQRSTGVTEFMLFIENPEVIPAVEAFAAAHLPAVKLQIFPADAPWYANQPDRYPEEVRALPTARQIENLRWAKSMAAPSDWLITVDVDEVVILDPAVHRRHPGAPTLPAYLTHETAGLAEVRFRIAEFIPPSDGRLRRGLFPPRPAVRTKAYHGAEPRRLSRWHLWKYKMLTQEEKEGYPIRLALFRALAPGSHDVLGGRHLRGHSSSKSAFRGDLPTKVNMHGGIQWWIHHKARINYPVRESKEIWLAHFDVFNLEQMQSKFAHIDAVLARGDSRSPGRVATLEGYRHHVLSGPLDDAAFFRRFISMRPWAFQVARLLGLARTLDLSAVVDCPEPPAEADTAYSRQH